MNRTSVADLEKFFDPIRYSATKWSTREEKQAFAVALVRFFESECNPNLFRKPLYTRLSNCFGHIAHFNRFGFYAEWFSTPERREDWVAYICSRPVYGDPTWTFSDVERDIVLYARSNWRTL